MARLLIAHRAGNDLDELAKAFAIGVDYAETDVWLFRGRLEARHDKTAGPLPFLWERWSLKPGWGRRLTLSDVVRASIGRGKLYLDLKGNDERLPATVTSELQAMGIEEVAFSSGVWWYLDELRKTFPKAALFYTISNGQSLLDARPRLERGDFKAIAIHGEVVTREAIAELRAGGVQDITTWGVETMEQANAMFDAGVNGVTSQNLELLAELRKRG